MSTNDSRIPSARNSVSTFSTLRKYAALALFGTGVLSAVPCPIATVDVYVANFGFGKGVCTISATTPGGNPVELTISKFTFVDIGPGVGLPATQLLVTPLTDLHGIGFQITPTVPWTAANQRRVDDEVQYIATATKTAPDWPGIDRLFTELNGSVVPPGFDVVVEVICPGGTTLPPDQFCPGGNGQAKTLYFGPTPVGGGTSVVFFTPAFSPGPNSNCLGVDPTTGKPVCVYSSIAISKDMDANATQGGSATITRVVNQFGRPTGGCTCPPVALSRPAGSQDEFAALLRASLPPFWENACDALVTRWPYDMGSLAR